MPRQRARPLSLPVGILTAAIPLVSALGCAIMILRGSPVGVHAHTGGTALGYLLASLGSLAAILAAALFHRQSQSWPGRLYMLAMQFLLVGSMIFLASEAGEEQAYLCTATAAGISFLLGIAVINSEERRIRVVPGGRDVVTVSELPKCAACSMPLSVQSRVMPWAVLVVGDILLGVGAYKWWAGHLAQGGASFERTAPYLAAQGVGAVAVVWWLLYRRFWWRCSGCGNEGPSRVAMRPPASLSPGVSDKSFGEPKRVDIDYVCPSCGGAAYSEDNLMRTIAAGFWLVGVALVLAGGLVFAWGIEESKPAGYIFGVLLVAAGGLAVWLGFRYVRGARSALRCELCGYCFASTAPGPAETPNDQLPD